MNDNICYKVPPETEKETIVQEQRENDIEGNNLDNKPLEFNLLKKTPTVSLEYFS